MFVRVINGHLRVRNGSTGGCGIRMPRNVHFNVPSGESISKKINNSNVDRITKDIVKMVITPKDTNKNKPKKYIKF